MPRRGRSSTRSRKRTVSSAIPRPARCTTSMGLRSEPELSNPVVVAAGAKAGQVFRLRGHGLPRLSGEGVGDLFVTVRVELPNGLDARTDELVRELERLLPVAPRH